jgi:hypothetical protein
MTDTETRTLAHAPTYADYAADLRALADILDDAGYRLPLPRYPSQGLDIQIHTASHLDVDQAAKILDVPTSRPKGSGHTTANLDVGTVHVRFVHVSDAAMAAHTAKMAYAAKMSTAAVSA